MKRLVIILSGLILLASSLGLVLSYQSRQSSQHFKKNNLSAGNSADNELGDYYRHAQLMQPNSQTATVNFLAGGDIMLSRNVAGQIAKAHDPLLPFRAMADILKSTDFNFANLESPLSGRNEFSTSSSLVFNAPVNFSSGLSSYNFGILNLANNHAMDQGLAGLTYTDDFLSTAGINHVGTGKNLTAAWQPAYITKHDIKIAFIGASYSSLNDNGKTTNQYIARIEQTDNLREAIRQATTAADFIVVTMHAGTEYTRTPNPAQIAFAHAAIDAGADLVIGAHPHWIQTIEQYQGKYIFYSLGNFIFDQEWSQETKQGLALKITLTKPSPNNPIAPGAASADAIQGPHVRAKLQEIKFLPIILENYCCPRPASPTEAATILAKIGVSTDTINP